MRQIGITAGAMIAGAVAALSMGGAASAATHHRHAAPADDKYAPPAQPVPYSQLDSYLNATPDQRASGPRYGSTRSTCAR